MLADGDPREVQNVARLVDELMVDIADQTGSGDSTRIAVLACFHLADQLRAAEALLRRFEGQSARISALLADVIGDEAPPEPV